MRLIEADKVEKAIKDYWKAQVDKAPIPKSTKEYNAYVNCLDAILERNDGLLKAIDELPSAEPKAISKWKKEFREYVDSLDITRDDWKGIIEYIDDAPTVQPETNCSEIPNNWIPCSERLPEEGEVVLTQAKFKDDVKMAVSSRIDYNYWTTWGTRDINIIAWMPLPEPYQKRGDQDGMEK